MCVVCVLKGTLYFVCEYCVYYGFANYLFVCILCVSLLCQSICVCFVCFWVNKLPLDVAVPGAL